MPADIFRGPASSKWAERFRKILQTGLGAVARRKSGAPPYHSWERGLNEHTNGLDRSHRTEATTLSSCMDAPGDASIFEELGASGTFCIVAGRGR